MRPNKLKDPEINPEGWQKEWPTEPDTLWWFYGWKNTKFGKELDKMDFVLVEVRQIANGITYIASGNFFYKEECVQGIFRRVIPVLPEEPK